jgi:hypothetical protein
VAFDPRSVEGVLDNTTSTLSCEAALVIEVLGLGVVCNEAALQISCVLVDDLSCFYSRWTFFVRGGGGWRGTFFSHCEILEQTYCGTVLLVL